MEMHSDTGYDGGLLFREMSVIESSEAKNMMPIAIIILIRCIAIVLIKAIDIKAIKSATWADFYILFWIVFLNLSLHFINALFILVGVLDFSRKLFYQKILWALLQLINKTVSYSI